MIPTLNSVTAGGGLALPDFVALAKDNGFQGVDFSIASVADLIDREGVAAARSLFEDSGVAPASFGLPVEWRKDEETFHSDLAALPRLLQAAQKIACTRCVTWVVPDGGLPRDEYRTRSTARFVEIARVLGAYNLQLGLEFLGPAHFRTNPGNVWFYDTAGALEVADEVNDQAGTSNVGLLVDCWHWYTSGGTIMDLAAIPVEQVVHVHINDAPNLPREQQRDNVRLLPGESGVIDIKGFLQTLKALGYDGPVAVETFSAELNELPPPEAAARAAAAMRKVWEEAGI